MALARRQRPDEPELSARRAFTLGLAAGALYFSMTLYWLIETMTTFGGLSTVLAAVAALLLVAYLSLFPAMFALVLARLVRTWGAPAALMTAPVWTATELGRQYVWDGFPWALLGYSQVTWLPIAQLASVTGVYGLSALLALAASAAAYIAIEPGRRGWAVAAATLALVVASTLWGQSRLSRNTLVAAGDPIRVAVLQGNIAQDDKWNPALADTITSRYLTMTRRALTAGASFVIWPETATPFLFEYDLAGGAAIRRLAMEGRATLLVGSDQVEPIRAEPGRTRPAQRLYNAAFLVQPDGAIGAVYRKMQLVPFGEYVPASRLLFFVGTIVDSLSPFTAGQDPVLLPIGAHRASTAICYEVIFASLMRRFVADGSELLTTITNDAWYGTSSAPYQHWEQASMRAIENGRYLARAANTGISGFVDPYGRVLQRSGLFEEALLVADLRFIRERTIYTRTGDLVAWLSLAVTLAALAVTAAGRRNRIA